MIVKSPPSPLDYFFLTLYFLLTIMFLYQGWVNFVNKELSKFSIDGFALFIINKFGSESARQRAKLLSKDPKKIRLFGIFALLGVIGGVYSIVTWFQEFK